MPIPDLIHQFCNFLSSQKRYSDNTVKSYLNDLVALQDFTNEQYELDDVSVITPQVLKSWLASLRESGIEARSVNRKLSAVRSFYKYLLRQQIIKKSPADGISSLKIKKNLPVFVEEQQMKPLLDREFFPNGFQGDSHFLIMILFYMTGMRVSELTSVKETDVQFASAIIKVTGKGNKQRNIPLGNKLLDIIKSYLKEKRKLFDTPNEYLVVSDKNLPLSRGVVYKIVKQTLAEVTTIRKRSPHVLRHSFATHLSDHGASIGAIKDLLGHSSLAATQVYTHTSIAKLKEIHKKSHPKS